MTKEFNSLKEIEKYYDKNTNTYIFKENDKFINKIVFNFDLNVESNIIALNIKAYDIKAYDINALDINADDIKAYDISANDINAGDINALDINANDINANDINANDINALDINADDIKAYDISANDINYYAVCCAYKNIKCNSIKGRRHNAKHFVLDGKLEIIKDE